jgi:Flp pilus assembly protein TadD
MVEGILFLSCIWLGQADRARVASNLNDEGLKLLDQGRFEQATSKFQAVQADPQNVATLNNLGAALRKQKGYEGAVRTLQRALRLQPNDARIYINLGLALQGLQRPAESVEAFRRASTLEPTNPAIHRDLGIELTEADDPGALKELTMATELDARDAVAHAELGSSYLKLSDFGAAESELRRVVDLNPQSGGTPP